MASVFGLGVIPVSGFHKDNFFSKVSTLLDGGFEPSVIAAYYNCDRRLIRKVRQLKEEGKSLSPKKGTGRPRKSRI